MKRLTYLARKDSKILAIFGAGSQGRTQSDAACTIRKIEKAWIYERHSERAAVFAKEMAGKGSNPLGLRSTSSPQETVIQDDIFYTATTSCKET